MTRKPSDRELAAELVTAVKEIYTSDVPVTVNGVRQRVEEKLDLDEGFFRRENWKDKSKQIIKDAVAKLDSDETVTPSPTVTKPPKGQKRGAPADAGEQTPTPNKRHRKQPASAKAKADETDPSESPVKERNHKPRAPAKNDEDSELSEPGEASKASQPAGTKQKAQRNKPKPRKKARAAKEAVSDVELSEDDEDEPKAAKRTQRRKSAVKKLDPQSSGNSDQSGADDHETEEKGSARRGGVKPSKVVESEEDEDNEPAELEDGRMLEPDSELSEVDETPNNTRRRASKNNVTQHAEEESDVPEDNDNEDGPDNKTSDAREGSDTEHSIVFDEPPKRKRGRKSKEASHKPAAKSRGKVGAEVTPEQEEIKKLQGQLLKCGVRKVWGNILKRYGDDNRAKIRHLKDMLKEIGMEGRFSDAKARQIKEQRELQAELEAVKEFQDHWGKGNSGRASRSRAARPKKSLKVDDDSDDSGGDKDEAAENGAGSEDEDEEDEEDDVEPMRKRAKAMAKRRADFAFLGDEEESD